MMAMSGTSIVAAIGEIIDVVRAGGDLITGAIQSLNGSRSVVVEIDNNTQYTLAIHSHHHDHGGFSSALPSGHISPNSADVFGSQSASWSVLTGTEGRIRYQGDEFEFWVYWNNPFGGGNDCACYVFGKRALLFQTLAICGNGNTDAHMRLVLSPSTRAYRIVNRRSAKVLDVPGFATKDGIGVQQYDYNGGANQQWQLFPVDNTDGNYYVIKNRHSGKVLDVAGASAADQAKVQQFKFHGGANQQWRLATTAGGLFPLGGSYFKIVNRHSEKVLDIPGGSADSQVPLQQFEDHGGQNQQWLVLPL
jgi:hypothetical protein